MGNSWLFIGIVMFCAVAGWLGVKLYRRLKDDTDWWKR